MITMRKTLQERVLKQHKRKQDKQKNVFWINVFTLRKIKMRSIRAVWPAALATQRIKFAKVRNNLSVIHEDLWQRFLRF